MRIRRVTILAFGVIACATTAFVAYLQTLNSPTTVIQEVRVVDQTEVLIVTKKLNPGDKMENALEWASRSTAAMGPNAILREAEPEAIAGFAQLPVRHHLMSGHILQSDDFVSADQRALSLQLKPNMRAVAVTVQVDTTAGGFILPNDKVDVIIGRMRSDPNKGGTNYNGLPNVITETILRGVRVLAIDQVANSNDSEEPVIIGKTATLELTSKQAEVMVAAQQVAQTIALALRSSVDGADEDINVDHMGEEAKDANYLVYSPGPKGGVRLITSSKIVEVGVRR